MNGSPGFRVLAVSTGLSVLVNGLAFYGIDRAVTRSSDPHYRMPFWQKEKKEAPIEIDYVEAPAKTRPEAPSPDAAKMADRDALAQDQKGDKTDPQGAPKTAALGPADQLAQNPNAASSPPPAPQAPPPQQQSPAQTEQKPVPNPGTNPVDEMRMPAPRPEPKPAAQGTPQAPPPPQTPQAPGLTGRDKILTQELSRTRSRGARLYGATSFEATGSGMGEYMKHLKERVWLQWFPYLAFRYPLDPRGASAVIRMVVDSKGKLRVAQVVESEGAPAFATFCLEALQKASPFGDLPQEMLALVGKDELEIYFGFHYQ